MIVLDTSVLSAAFRRRRRGAKESRVARILHRMITEDHPLSVPGIVLQEFLSGSRTGEQFERLASLATGFRILTADQEHHVSAARIANACRRSGISTSPVDCLIAAQTIAAAGRLFTLDDDFARMAPRCGLRLFRFGAPKNT